MRLLAHDRYTTSLGYRYSVDEMTRILATLATFSHVPQENCPAAKGGLQYVDPLPNEDRDSTLFCSSAAATIQTCAVVSATSASALTHAVKLAKSAVVLVSRVRILIYLLSSGP